MVRFLTWLWLVTSEKWFTSLFNRLGRLVPVGRSVGFRVYNGLTLVGWVSTVGSRNVVLAGPFRNVAFKLPII